MNDFTDVQIKCADDVLNVHKLALCYSSEYFRKYYTIELKVGKSPKLKYRASVVATVLEHTFYGRLYNVKKRVFTYADLGELYRCADFLDIKDTMSGFVKLLVYNVTGPYDESAFAFLKLYPTILSTYNIEAMTNPHVLELLHISEVSVFANLSMCTSKKCYDIYVAGYRPNVGPTWGTFMHKVSSQFTFTEYHELYKNMLEMLTNGDAEGCLRIHGILKISRSHLMSRKADPDFNMELSAVMDKVMDIIKKR